MHIELATKRLVDAQEILCAIDKKTPLKNCLHGIFENEAEHLNEGQAIEAYKIALEDAGKLIF